MIQLMLSDVRAKARWCYADDSPRAVLKALMTDGTLAMVTYRLMQWAKTHRLAPLEWFCNRFIVLAGGCVIGRGAEFGPGFVLIHSMGVVINGQVRGGAGVHIEHQVTIGAERRGSPRLGDDVFIGAGAKIVGAVVIGSHTRIGANAVVVDDVPDYATAVGVPARVVHRHNTHFAQGLQGGDVIQRQDDPSRVQAGGRMPEQLRGQLEPGDTVVVR
jgi:serine O-acetyltransferase